MPNNQHKKYYGGYVPTGNEPSAKEREDISKRFLASYRDKKLRGRSFAPLPSVDWSNLGGQNYVSPVKNQGACRSCVAFSAVAVVESMLKIKNGADTNSLLSEAYLFYCVALSQGRTCLSGWSLEPSQQAFQNTGVCDSVCYQYSDVQQSCIGLCADWKNRVTKTTGYTPLAGGDAIRAYLSATGPVQTGFSIYSDFYTYKKNDIYIQDPAAKYQEAHALCIIGFNDNAGYWICKNCWGTDWGDQGFCNIGYGQCGIDAYALGVAGIV
ncbi:C1 family peptidase [Mucilaginibacter sp. X4EP1]|uniref:C1 family peptidase n=1 Tax=Mucilaginibacter sp. X4EP1 TaxID=2723092 RepID=UPI00216A1DF2|nr:C1 family peptidase [Mucilaginibacter sp. X4EP1]MCS3814359.1 C1A family cysteine protease [Mucilaginibacter sp. X4EP1]